jgi:hypothetical protein
VPFPGGEGGATLVDLDGDGIDDVAATVEGVFEETVTRAWFSGHTALDPEDVVITHAFGDAGSLGSTAGGDVDGDGFEDLLLASTAGSILDFNGIGGSVSVFLGPLSGAYDDADRGAVLLGDADHNGHAGFELDAASDLTGDGMNDVVVLDAQAHPDPEDGFGRLYVVPGPALGVSFLADEPVQFGPHEGIGAGVAMGDLDGDGYGDLAATDFADAGLHYGSAWVFFGPLENSLDESAADVTLPDIDSGSVALPGDVDGDGNNDLVADVIDDPQGRPYHLEVVFDPQAVVTAGAFIVPSVLDNSPLMVAGPGDIDGDGRADVLAGSPGAIYDGVQMGGAWLILGASTGY